MDREVQKQIAITIHFMRTAIDELEALVKLVSPPPAPGANLTYNDPAPGAFSKNIPVVSAGPGIVGSEYQTEWDGGDIL